MISNSYGLFDSAVGVGKIYLNSVRESFKSKKAQCVDLVFRTILASILAAVLAKLMPSGEARVLAYVMAWGVAQAVMYKVDQYRTRHAKYIYCSNVVISKLKDGEYSSSIR